MSDYYIVWKQALTRTGLTHWKIEDPNKRLIVSIVLYGGHCISENCLARDIIRPAVLPIDNPAGNVQGFLGTSELELLVLTGISTATLDEWFGNGN